MKNIIFVGYMGSGKSTISQKLGKNLKKTVLDLDNIIAEKAGISINAIFETHGESYFRRLETEVLKEAMNRKGVIISCGGGIVLKDENLDIMKENGIIIWLKVSPETTFKRTRMSDDRPLLKNKSVEDIKKMMQAREEYYKKAAHFEMCADKKKIDDVIREIKQFLNLNDTVPKI